MKYEAFKKNVCTTLILLAIMALSFLVATGCQKIDKPEITSEQTTKTAATVTAAEPRTVLEDNKPDTDTETEAETSTVETNLSEQPSTGSTYSGQTDLYPNVPLDNSFKAWVIEYATQKGVYPGLVFGIMYVESGFDPKAYGGGNYGLMQINQVNLAPYGITDPYDPYQNAKAGIDILAYFFERYPDQWNRVLMSYNSGEGAATQQWNSGVTDTQYTIAVNRAMQVLSKGV